MGIGGGVPSLLHYFLLSRGDMEPRAGIIFWVLVAESCGYGANSNSIGSRVQSQPFIWHEQGVVEPPVPEGVSGR